MNYSFPSYFLNIALNEFFEIDSLSHYRSETVLNVIYETNNYCTSYKIYLIKEFKHLKDEENDRLKSNWNFHRSLAKVNYRIHTDAIKENLIPAEITKQQAKSDYASKADLLNVALFGMTAKP